MSLNYPEMVLLDLDGTLVDTVPDLAFCLDKMLEELALPKAGETKVRGWVGNGIETLVKRSLSNDFASNDFSKEPEALLFNKAMSIFIDYYKKNTCKRSQLYAGVKEGLEYLTSNNFKLGLVTNKMSYFTNIILKTLNIHKAFGIIISGDTLTKKKPDPMPLLHAAQHFGASATQALMIGDSITDVTAARCAGFQVLCVSYGYNLGQDIRLANPDHVVDSLADLVNIFHKK